MYRISKYQETVMRHAADYGEVSAGARAEVERLCAMCGTRVGSRSCSRCYVDAAIHCYAIIRRAGYEVTD